MWGFFFLEKLEVLIKSLINGLLIHITRSIRTVEEGSIAQSRMDQRSTSNDGRAQITYMDADFYTAASQGNITRLQQLQHKAAAATTW